MEEEQKKEEIYQFSEFGLRDVEGGNDLDKDLRDALRKAFKVEPLISNATK